MKKPGRAAGLAAYYSTFGQAAACLALHPRYEDCGIAAKRTRAFAEAVGARVELKIEKATSGALVRVLEDWCPPFAGYFLYYPSRRQQPVCSARVPDPHPDEPSGLASRECRSPEPW